ncbi:hypothetical protein A2555_02275 [Candidatus Falkowbacteria bacterium RIFOXYD2_FULL_39_16]|nr:MAG: hypothetical protein A2555_02275 [Candidatus Falkowbacteria bacterium RIFOXYD2_FULL_39_16]
MPKIKILLFTVLSVLLTMGAGCSDDMPEDQRVDYEEDIKPIIETTTKPKVRGSCNVIDSKGTCVDFIGEVFTEERMKLSCVEGKFSLDACPYSDLGGCQATGGTITESIIWSYAPITPEEAGYQAKSCNALGAGKWVTPASLLGN